MNKKYRDLQPWLDYFDMLHEYEKAGFLQMVADRHEAFVTQPAIHAMSDGDDVVLQMRDGSIEKTALRLRTYAAWLATAVEDYLRKPFAIHVVTHDEQNVPLFTILLTKKRRFFKRKEKIEWIDYTNK